MEQKKLTVQQNMLYNSIGSISYLACQWLITVLVVRLSNYENAGNLALVVSVTNMFYTIASFGIRAYQVSDIRDQYAPSDYIYTRYLTCTAGALLCVIFIFADGHYTCDQIACILMYMLFRVSEAWTDVYHGIDQKAWRMDIIGISGVIRGIISLVVFCVALYISQSLFFAITTMTAALYAVLFCYDIPHSGQLIEIIKGIRWKKIGMLLWECWPLMLNGFLLSGVVSIPRYNLERICSETILGYYGSVATPAVIVQTASSLLFNPLISSFSVYYEEKDKKKFLLLIRKVIFCLLAVSVVVILGAALLGRWGLALLFGEGILPYAYLLIPVIFTTIMIAFSWFIGTLLTIVRRLKSMLVANACAAALAALVSPMLIQRFQMDGVNYAIYLAVGVSLVIQIAVLYHHLRRHFAKLGQAEDDD